MTSQEIFSIWAPDGATWSPWVKPVLFAHAAEAPLAATLSQSETDIAWAPPADGKSAIVVDVSGSAGIYLGIALAERGYRPLPLYNAVPGPPMAALVDVWPIVHQLIAASSRLAELNLPPDAPPAFLLDAARRTGAGDAAPGRFDNRSVSFPTDFPSANFLLSRGIERALLVQETTAAPQPDLAHTLLRWQQAGIRIEAKQLRSSGPITPIVVTGPRFYRWLWYRLLTLSGLRRNPLGGFGGILPAASGG